MIVYPAIDIRGGRAVRLIEGDYSQETVYDADPIDAARRWAGAGADWIHIVDLDGARDGIRANAGAITHIREAIPLQLELGGGLRTLDDVETVADLGINRMVIGSAAITHPELVTEAVKAFGDRIAVGLDARDGKLAAQGWIDQTDIDAVEAARRFADVGVCHVIFTDIRRDGRMRGPNLEALKSMIDQAPMNVIASGGISSLEDVRNVRDLGAAGVIIGAALYQQAFRLADALSIAKEGSTAT